MKKKHPISYRCVEGTGYFAENCSKEEAWQLILAELGVDENNETSYVIDNLQQVEMRKCLDCGSFWSDSNECGECGEQRMSKRFHLAWYLEC